eukprot:12520811-Alexandrium_andersonii.AAC.1
MFEPKLRAGYVETDLKIPLVEGPSSGAGSRFARAPANWSEGRSMSPEARQKRSRESARARKR